MSRALERLLGWIVYNQAAINTAHFLTNSYLYFPQRFSNFFWKVALGNKTKYVFLINMQSSSSKVYKICRNQFFCFQLQLLQFLSLNICAFDPGLGAVIYLQPSNLSSAIQFHLRTKKSGGKQCSQTTLHFQHRQAKHTGKKWSVGLPTSK